MWEKISIYKIVWFLIVVLCAIVILGVRFPVRAQEISFEQWVEIVQGAIAEASGQAVIAETIGATSDDPNLRGLLASEDDTFIIKGREQIFEISMGDLPQLEGIVSPEATKLAIADALLTEGEEYLVVGFDYGPRRSFVFFPSPGEAPTGLVLALSREYIPNLEIEEFGADGCSSWLPITLNILRRPAEKVQVCARATCQIERPVSCFVSAINQEVGLFAELDTAPNPPADMVVEGGACYGDTNYQISYLNFSVNALLLNFDVGFEFGGSMESSINCDGAVSLKHR